jgi:Ca-activated chloride channel family protein
MQTLLRAALLAGAWGVCVSTLPAQIVERPPVLSARTELVILPVTVIDRKGAFVTGLHQNDFTVYDNGEPRAIQFFTSEDVPATIGLVIDRSTSMRGQGEQIAAAITALGALAHPLDEYFIVNFNERVWLGLPPSNPFTTDRNLLQAAISSTPAAGMSAVYDALDRALGHLQLGARDRKALIVLSDGGDNASSHSLEEVIERARRSDAAIYSVALFDRDDRDARPRALKTLARETGGEAFTPSRAHDIPAAFIHIGRELRSGYTIGFVPPDTADEGFRSIRVVASLGDKRPLTVRTRAGYYAQP